MNSLNQIILEGRVVQQPEERLLPTGTSVCSLPIAVNRSWKNNKGETQQEVSFFQIDTFGKLAEVCVKWAGVGRSVRVVGRLKQDRWKGSDGKNNSRIHIVAEHIELLALSKKQKELRDQKLAMNAKTSALIAETNAAALAQETMEEVVPF